ncbi:hypothetical protein KMW28_07135 [Flammeovirga yaeyamensis]|uniref:Lipoprotein n=1 Tax=Flammeovirga yaeyamensis TaxID=367791 RepID=A0AAX1NBA7_9BACT|nr:hypothetical protein [Flammeovirga yaeyamensis]MBB3697952.1 hypothetical protein [Flammeovirga yaeyamensis]NMF35695.1 hypothetical protein [Flammeovirga yaeyamensis]QWG03352.1 hypothetical protein KMW28_07135 [Flammeovirga yaeyamensis]
MKSIKILFTLISAFIFFGCSQDENLTPDQAPVESQINSLFSFTDFTKNGVVDIAKNEDGSVNIIVELSQPASEHYEVKLYEGMLDADLEVQSILDLSPIESGNTISSTDVSNTYSYEELMSANIHLRVTQNNDHDVKSATDLGANAFKTSEIKTYPIIRNGDEVGTSAFIPRENGPMMVGVSLYYKDFEYGYEIDIYAGTALEGNNENVLIDLIDINERTSKSNSYTNLDEGYALPIDIEDGYLRIDRVPTHQGEEYYSKTDIGGNELTGRSISYDFDRPGSEDRINGWVKLEERVNGNTLFSYQMTGEVIPSSTYAVNLNDNNYILHGENVASLGKFPANFEGVTYADVKGLKDGSAISYDQIIEGTYSVRMNKSNDPDYNGKEVYAVSDIGQAALTDTMYEADITFTHPDFMNENMNVKIYKRLNGFTLLEVEGSDYTNDNIFHDLELYTGKDHESQSSSKVAYMISIDRYYHGYRETSPYEDPNNKEITFDEMMEQGGHYRLLDSDGEEIGYAVLPN